MFIFKRNEAIVLNQLIALKCPDPEKKKLNANWLYLLHILSEIQLQMRLNPDALIYPVETTNEEENAILWLLDKYDETVDANNINVDSVYNVTDIINLLYYELITPLPF